MQLLHRRKVRLSIGQLEERTTPVFAKWPFAGGPGVDPLIGVYGQYQDLKDYGTLGDVTTATGYDTFVHFHEGIDIASSVSGRSKPARDGRFKTSHFEERVSR